MFLLPKKKKVVVAIPNRNPDVQRYVRKHGSYKVVVYRYL